MRIHTRIVVSSLTASLICFVVEATSVPPAKAQEQIAADAAKARVLTAKELNAIYEDRTWRWKDGAGYFGTKNRAFAAWAGIGEKASYAEGSWSADDRGRVCSRATWHGTWGKNKLTNCQEHRTDDKNIYQRSLPNGKWYIFSHLPAQPDDEMQKNIQPGDHVLEDYQKNKQYVAQHARGKKKR